MTPQVPRLALTINAPPATVEAFKALAKAEGISHHALLQKMVDNHTRHIDRMNGGDCLKWDPPPTP